MLRRTLLSTSLCTLCVSLALFACGGEEPPPEVDTTPIVGLMELPISRNNQGSRPQSAGQIEISQRELRLDHVKLLDLERGRPAEAQVAEHVLTPLLERLRTGAARARVSIKVQSHVPYLTLAEVLNTVQQAGIHEVHFAVRAPGATPTEGWMPIASFQVVGHGAEIEWGSRTLPWSAFTEHWREVYQACRAPGRPNFIDCDAPYTNVAEGGELQMDLWTRGQGMKVTFSQVNAEEPEGEEGSGQVATIEGVAPAPTATDSEEEEGQPATRGSFNLRHQQAIVEDSPISALVQPVCGNQACQSVVSADASGASLRIVSMLGAVYANGFTPGEVVFRLPEE